MLICHTLDTSIRADAFKEGEKFVSINENILPLYVFIHAENMNRRSLYPL